MRAIALVVAVPVEAWRFVFSDRISGLGNCWRGTLVLARIRWFRAGVPQIRLSSFSSWLILRYVSECFIFNYAYARTYVRARLVARSDAWRP